MKSYTSSVEVGFEVLRENLKCPENLMVSYISSVEVVCVYINTCVKTRDPKEASII